MKRGAASNPPRKHRDLAGAVVLAGTGVAILASWLAIDPRSIDAYEAPKLLLAQVGIAAASAAALGKRLAGPSPWRLAAGRAPRVILALFAAGILGAFLSAASSRHPASSLDTMRSACVFLLALGAGASLASSNRLSGANAFFVAGATVNAVLVVLAARDLYSPFIVFGQTRRTALGALLGNAGHLGICLALAGVALLPYALAGRARWPARAALAATLAGIVATQTLSGLAAFAAGAAACFVLRLGRRGVLPIAAAVLLLAASAGTSRQLRFRVMLATRDLHRGDWNAALSARAAPWLAGAEMVRSHPWLGVGPGNFASEFVPQRLAAEARYRQRLVVRGMATNSFAQAHSDYLEVLAAVGIPAGLCFIAAYLLLVARVLSLGRRDAEAAAAGSSLVAGGVAAATWFPFQITTSGVWLVLLAGAAFSLLGSSERGER